MPRAFAAAHPCAGAPVGGIRAADRGCAATDPPTARRSQRGPTTAAAILAAEATATARARISPTMTANASNGRILVGAGLAPLGGRQAARSAQTGASGASPALQVARLIHPVCGIGVGLPDVAAPGRAGSALLFRGPVRPGEPVTDQPAGTRTGMSACSPQHRKCCRRTPAPAHAPEGQDVRRAGRLGCPFFGLPFFGQAKKGNSAAAEADETSRQDHPGREKPRRYNQPTNQPASQRQRQKETDRNHHPIRR